MSSPLLQLLGVNLVFILVIASVILALALWRRPAYAVLKRNFLAYFTSPIGYVFLCAFVCLTAFAAFWSEEFFNANLANLDQLNRYLPLILLVFIPAITMSIWSEERRQGTDELLLTIPATDFDIVLGKYLAAVSIYTVSLLFSQICNFTVLSTLGNPDVGLLLGNYLGYWLAGLAMLSIGMVASFLTNNLTVGFVLGVLLNAPLVMSGYSDVLLGSEAARTVSQWSIEQQFKDFQRGVVSLGSVLFFLMLAAVMFYICLVLIGRRHWSGGRDGRSMGGHYLLRGLSLIVAVGAACVLLPKWDRVRADLTSEQLNSLHPKSKSLVEGVKPRSPVRIDAYVSTELPEEFVKRRVDLFNKLREVKNLGNDNVQFTLHEVELFSPEADKAKAEYGIEPQEVQTMVRGAPSQRNIIFGFGARSGLERVVVPFLGQGSNIEQELVRAVVTVADANTEKEETEDGAKSEGSGNSDDKKSADTATSDGPKPRGRKKIGVVETQVPLFASDSPRGGGESTDAPVIQELRRQYKVVKIDPQKKFTNDIEVLLVIQPSTLNPTGMTNLIDAIRTGKPTAIFEDPMALSLPLNYWTTFAQMPRGGGMGPMGPMPPETPGDLKKLWELLGIRLRISEKVREEKQPRQHPFAPEPPPLKFYDAYVGWQDFNPHEADTDKLRINNQWVFVTRESGAAEPFDKESPLVAGMQEVLFMYPGRLEPGTLEAGAINPTHTPLIRSSPRSGLVEWNKLIDFKKYPLQLQPPDVVSALERESIKTDEGFVLAYHVKRPAPADGGASKEGKDAKEGKTDPKEGAAASNAEENAVEKDAKNAAKKDGGLNVVVVADVDVLGEMFFNVRSMGRDTRNEFAEWNLDNVPLVLNMLDVLSGDDRFVEIRRHRPRHRELATISKLREEAKSDRQRKRKSLDEEFEKAQTEAKAARDKKRKELQNQELNERTLEEANIAMNDFERQMETAKEKRKQERDAAYKSIDRELASQVHDVQNRYKILAVALPPLLPLLIAGCVYLVRRSREGEGVSQDRIV